MTEAWGDEQFRNNLTWDMARTVSKMGELFYEDDYLALLGRALTNEQQLALFQAIREESPHRESEFRPRFEPFFSRCAPHLPAPLTPEQIQSQLLEQGFDYETASEWAMPTSRPQQNMKLQGDFDLTTEDLKDRYPFETD